MTFDEFLAARYAVWRETAPRAIASHKQTLANTRLSCRVLDAAEREIALEETYLAVANGERPLPAHWRVSLEAQYQRQYGDSR